MLHGVSALGSRASFSIDIGFNKCLETMCVRRILLKEASTYADTKIVNGKPTHVYGLVMRIGHGI